MRFDTVYRTVLESIADLAKAVKSTEIKDFSKEVADQVAAFIHHDEYKPYFKKVKKKLNAELNKVKAKDERLKNVRLEYVSDCPDYDGIPMMKVWRNEPDVIQVNLSPFLISCNGDFSDESIENAIVDYIYNPDNGEHTIQHECAHMLDFKYYKSREGCGEHDEFFEKLRKDLDKIPPQLDDDF